MYVNYLIIILLTEKKNYITHIALIDAAPLAHRGCISNYNHTLANYNAHTNAHTLKHKHTHIRKYVAAHIQDKKQGMHNLTYSIKSQWWETLQLTHT